MATRKTPAQGTKSVRTRSGEAGKPVSADVSRESGAAPPTEAELDQRDRMKSGPRRPAGPPLAGDTPEPEVTRSLPADALPPPTDPK